MEVIKQGSVEVDRCHNCKGIWFDEFELETLKKEEESEAVDTGDAKVGKEQNKIDRLTCPKCSTQMIRMVDLNQTHIWFEHCTVCGGNFLDAGEFRDLMKEDWLDHFKALITPERK
jgi:uncharacterized protein